MVRVDEMLMRDAQVLFTDQKGKSVAHNPGTLDIVEGEGK